MMPVRAKFRLTGWTTKMGSRWNEAKKNYEEALVCDLEFNAVYSNTPENNKFWDATPSGQIKMSIVNPEAVKEFTIGRQYYVDFTEAP